MEQAVRFSILGKTQVRPPDNQLKAQNTVSRLMFLQTLILKITIRRKHPSILQTLTLETTRTGGKTHVLVPRPNQLKTIDNKTCQSKTDFVFSVSLSIALSMILVLVLILIINENPSLKTW